MPSTSGVTQLRRPAAERGTQQVAAKKPATPKVTVKDIEKAESAVALAHKDEDANLDEFGRLCDCLLAEIEQLVNSSDSTQRKELHQQIMIQSLQLRAGLRQFNYRLQHWRDECAAQRHAAEQKHVMLMNLVHQVHHLCKEIHRCTDFKSMDEQIDMVPIDQFYNEAPEEITKPDVTHRDGHELRLARLNWELEQRKRMAADSDSLEAKRAAGDEANAQLAEQLQQLKPKLNALLEASRPLQSSLSMEMEQDQSQWRLCKRLPRPLFCLYLHANAFAQTQTQEDTIDMDGPSVTVEIRNTTHAEVLLNESTDEAKGTSRVRSASPDKKSRHSKKSKQADDSTRNESGKDRGGDAAKLRALAARPLSVVISVQLPTTDTVKSGTAVLVFRYMEQLKTVGVLTEVKLDLKGAQPEDERNMLQTVLSDSTLLADLLQTDDMGTECLDPCGVLLLQKFGMRYCDHACRLGHAFEWAQRLAGLRGKVTQPQMNADDDLPTCLEDCDIVAGVDLVQRVVSSVRDRCLHRVELYRAISLCKSLDVASAVSKLEAGSILNAPSNVATKLSQWSNITYDDFTCHELNVEQADIAPLDYFYTAKFDHPSGNLSALVAVPVGYPRDPPLFFLSLDGDGKGSRTAFNDAIVKDLERVVNTLVPLAAGLSSDLLMNQVKVLMSRFDLTMNTAEGGGQGTQLTYLVQKKNRGNARELPYLYDCSTRCFTF